MWALTLGSVATSAGVVVSTWGARRDVDYWWHALLGSEVLSGVTATPGDWTSLVSNSDWRTTQVLGELVIAGIDAVAPTTGHLQLRAWCAGAAFLAVLGVLKPWYPQYRAFRMLAVLCGALTIAGFVQERPASMVLALFPLSGMAIGALLSHDAEATAFSFRVGAATFVVVVLWMLTHPSWLLPISVGVIAVLVNSRIRPVTRVKLVAAVSIVGIASADSWGRFRDVADAAGHIVEWQRTQLIHAAAVPLLLIAALWVGWWVIGHRPTRAQVCALVLLGVVGMSAWRHIPAVTLIALGMLAVEVDRSTPSPTTADRVFHRHSLGLCALGVLGALVLSMAVTPHRSPASPHDDVAELASHAQCASRHPITIGAHYNDHGAAIYGARRSSCAGASRSRVALDGRADRYGAEMIGRWQNTITGAESWQEVFAQAQIDHAVLPAHSPVTTRLKAAEWRALLCQGDYVLLRAPLADQG